MIKFSSATGEYVSSKVFGGTNNDDKIMTATATEDGGVLLGGWFYSKDFDIDGDGTNDITSTAGQNDAIIVKLNARNEVEWYKTFDGNSYDENYGITQLSNKSFVAVGGFDSTSLSCGDTANLLRSQGYSDAYIINLDNVVTSAEIPEIQEINVENKLKEFKITTEIEENSDGERGGSITGTPSENNINFVEKVKYDYDSITPILITPEAGYSVYSVEINGEKVEFRPDTNGVVTLPVFSKVQEDKHIKVLFEKNVSSVVVHHYIKDRDGNYTTDKAADDEYIIGKIGSKYETAPKIDIERYGLEKDTDGNYIIPSNAKGTFEQTETVVTYYYQETPFSLTVHHYLEGTEDKLEVDEVSSLYKDTEYTTSPSKELLKRYTLVSSATRVTPESAGTSGKIQENTEVSYYYKLKEYQITTEVKEHDETDIGGNISKVKGGNISGEEMTPYETVIINQDSTKDITITADEGYQIKSITIQSIDENGSITEENVKITGKNTTYNLNKFNDITSNKHVIVEFERIIGTLTVHHYVEGTTNHVPLADGSTADDESKSGYIGNNYATKARTDINENYELVGVPENSSGEYIDGNIEVIYYYKLKDTSVLVHHYLEGTTTKLAEDETKLGKVGDKYTTSSANVDSKYELVTTPNNANGTMTLDQIIVTYYYRVKDTSVLVHHYKEGTTEKVSEDVTKKGKIDDEYTTTIADDLPEYYELVEEPTNKTGTMTEEQIVVTYYYRLKKYQYTVNYLEKGTNKVLHEAKTTQNITYGTVINTKDEVIDINGYGYDSADKDSLSIEVSGNIINIYYTKVIGLSYTVNYLEKDTDEVIHPAKTTGEQVFETEITSADEVIDIDGYNYDSVDKDKLIIGTGENVINIYYTKRNDLSYTVNYLEKDTNKVLHEAKMQDGMTFEDLVNSKNYVIAIDGYNYDSVNKDTIIIGTGENVINIYYTKRTDLSYTVNYLEKNTNKVLHEPKVQEIMTFESNIISINEVIDIYGYSYDSVDKETLTITTSENIINIYYTKKDTKVTVHYYEEGTTNKVSEDIEIRGKVFDDYTTISADNIPSKYELVAIPSNAKGSMTEETIEVVYYYRVKETVVNIRYLEKGTNKVLANPDRLVGKDDDDYQTKAKEIEGYKLVEHTGNENGKFGVEPITITYYYLYKAKATVQYIDKITGKILEESTTDGLEGDDFVTESKDFEKYILVEEPPEKTVKMTKKEQVVKYYYTHVSDGVIEKHIDIISGQVIANDVHNGNEGDTYDIPARTFDGYDLVKDKLPANSKGTMKVEPVEVIYYYIYRTKVTAEYIDKNTGNKLAEEKVQNGYEGDTYTTDRKTFDDYKLVEVPSNADGSMTKENIRVTYYYVHTSGDVIVNHIDIKTGKKLLEETKEKGYEGDPYETHEENISGYDLVKEKYPGNATGKMTRGQIRVTYYYIKKTEVNVKYVDKETGEEIDEPTNIPGHEGDDYTTAPKDIPGYDLVEKTENKDGTMTVDPTEVIYYYKRPAKVIVNYYDIDTKEKITDEIEITGHQNDDYTTEQKDIKYYEISKVPENKEGKMIVTVTKNENGKEFVENTIYVNYYYRKLIFNLKVDQTITSVIVNGQETIINGTLGKVEVHRKNISTADIKVIYKIKVTNDSELTGKANVVENIPSGMIMIADDNPEWTINGTTASLETDEIKPGESREYQVVLRWQNGESNIGTKGNLVSIITENEAGFEEKDKTDNESKADLIVAVETGEVTYIAIAGSILIVMIAIASGIYVIKKKRQ